MKKLIILAALFVIFAVSAGQIRDIENLVEKFRSYDKNLYILTLRENSPFNSFLGKYFSEKQHMLVRDIAGIMESSGERINRQVFELITRSDNPAWTLDFTPALACELSVLGKPSALIESAIIRDEDNCLLEQELERIKSQLDLSTTLSELLFFEYGDLSTLLKALGMENINDEKRGHFQGAHVNNFSNGEICFTFDDGPNMGGGTEAIIEEFEKYGWQTTFFVLGSSLGSSTKFKTITSMMKNGGHNVGVHGWYHATKSGKPFTVMSSASVRKDITNAYRKIRDSYGSIPLTFRAPYGEFRKSDFSILKDLNLQYVGWHVDTNDWKKQSSDTLARNTINMIKKRKKGIVLMHDIQSKTVRAIPIILKWVHDNGYKVVTVESKI